MRYVALGDRTIGTSVGCRPLAGPACARSARRADARARDESGVNGYTSADLIRDELPALDDLQPELVSVLIGVNDVVQGVPVASYARNVERILDTLLAELPADRLLTVATPDYTVTPAGAGYGDPRHRTTGSSPRTRAGTRRDCEGHRSWTRSTWRFCG